MSSIIRSSRAAALSEFSGARRGEKPRYTTQKATACNIGENSSSNGQLINTDFSNGGAATINLSVDKGLC